MARHLSELAAEIEACLDDNGMHSHWRQRGIRRFSE
jgi:hypothetical protein